VSELNLLGKLVLLTVDGDDASAFPGSNQKRQWGQLNWQTLREFKQLLLPLEELVENEG
jgi:hypothetical protein